MNSDTQNDTSELREQLIFHKNAKTTIGGTPDNRTMYTIPFGDLEALIAQREQAAELRGGIKSLKKAQGRYIVEHKSEENPEFIKGWNGHRSHMTKELVRLTKKQATKPEKGTGE